ncbi:MAG: membrane protein insertion efficiency factor YidD [Deltaproteobacteria bacterium]|nr:membrane protein insertion efficiency factor YidD [Deltaproteobacteria bacterium]MBW2074885.1 membrane protein insertion efficiency factor YidD [Deltaproteobacteria bacterium]
MFLIFGFAPGVYGSPFRGPWREHDAKEASKKQVSNRFNPLRPLVDLYRDYISPIDGKECPMYPSCSAYSLLCFEKHGFFMGWMMTCDRLLHEADEMRKAPVIYVNGAERFYDPVENNDFWWHNER